MRTIIGILIGVLLIGALVWPGWVLGHPVWGPWQTQPKAETMGVVCNGQWFEMPKPADGSFYECEKGQPKLVTPIRQMPAGQEPTAMPTPAQDYPRVNGHPRDCLQINGNKVCIPLDDSRGMWTPEHTVTGKNKGMNYRSEIPAGWAVAYAAASCAVHADGDSSQTEYTNTPFIVIIGPWHGSVGCYSGGVHGVPVEWIGFLLETILPVHQAEVGYTIQPTFIGSIPKGFNVPADIISAFSVPMK